MSFNKNKASNSPMKKNRQYPSDPLLRGLTKARNYFYALDFASGGVFKYLTLLYGLKKANDIWKWLEHKETFNPGSMYAINSDSIDDSIERINKIMYNGNKDGIVDVDSYKKGLSEINVLTSRLNDIDNLYTSSKKEPLFSPIAGVYLSEHSIDNGELNYRLYPKTPKKTTFTVSESGGSDSKNFGKRKRRSRKRRSHKKQNK